MGMWYLAFLMAGECISSISIACNPLNDDVRESYITYTKSGEDWVPIAQY